MLFRSAETPLETLLEDARTLSLFASARLIVGYNAEALLLRGRGAADAGEDAPAPGLQPLDSYFRNPTPGTVVLLEAVRFDWDDRDERKKLERLANLFRAVPVQVEMRRLDPRAAFEAARALARKQGLRISDELLAELAEALGHEMARIANEISKLALYGSGEAGANREITREEMAALVPEARTSGIFEFTDALASRNRTRALNILDTLSRMDVYLPLQVNFLASLFRQIGRAHV